MRKSVISPGFARAEDDKPLPAKRRQSSANPLVQPLREMLPLVSTLCVRIVQDRLRRCGLSSVEKIVNINDEDTRAGIHPAQKLLGEIHVLVVAEPQQVISSRRALEPIGGRIVGQRHLQAAVAGETHEYTDMYPGMAKTAREEGFDEIANWFETLAKAERSHANRYTKALEALVD